jgi:hypothetical protein
LATTALRQRIALPEHEAGRFRCTAVIEAQLEGIRASTRELILTRGIVVITAVVVTLEVLKLSVCTLAEQDLTVSDSPKV